MAYNYCVLWFWTLILVFATMNTTGSTQNQIVNCGNGNDTIIFKSVFLKPDYLQISKTWNLEMDCYNTQTVVRNGDMLNIKLSWIDPSGTPIILTNENLDLCDLFIDLHDPCPWKPGTHHIFYYNQTWPNVFPTGKYEAKVVGRDNSGKDELFCIIAEFVLNN